MTEMGSISPKHKCWRCMWAAWCGDRFFCPLAVTCIREKPKAAKEEEDGTKADDGQ